MLFLVTSCEKEDNPNGPNPISYKYELEVSPETTVGDPGISYANPEFTIDGKYMIWFEPTGNPTPEGDIEGIMWHCGIEQETGELIPANGKGFAAFTSTVYKRANTGYDQEGPCYVGADPAGNLKLVRINGNTSGSVIDIPAAPDMDRRGIFPSKNPDSDELYIFWFKANPGPHPREAEFVEVRFITLSNPTNEVLVEHEDNLLPGSTWTSLDLAVPRWFAGLNEFTFGFPKNGNTEVKKVKVFPNGSFEEKEITNSRINHYDPSPYFFKGERYIMPGIDGSAQVQVYTEQAGSTLFKPFLTLNPSGSELVSPCRALSNEPFTLNNRYYTTFQISDCDQGGSFFTSNGEMYLACVMPEANGWITRIGTSTTDLVRNEPEVVVTENNKAFVFYSAYTQGIKSFGRPL
jgi:hypothetical protein